MIFKPNKMWSNQRPPSKKDDTGLTPSNAVLVEMAKDYKEKMPTIIGPGIENTRNFFLTDIAPSVMAMTNGLQDGFDVLKQVMGEEPQASQYFNAMNTMLGVALKTKMANFIAGHCNLSPEEKEIFIREVFDKPDKAETVTAKVIRDLAERGQSDTPLGVKPPDRRARARLAKIGELNHNAGK